MQVLRDVVAAVAGADHDGALALPALAVVILAGMHHLAGKVLQAGDFRHARNAADAGRQHDMARMHGALAAVGAAQRHRPAAVLLVVTAALELGLGPEVQLHGLDIGLEPVGELVLRNVGRPVRREVQIGQVIDLNLIMQRQRMVALAPIVADTLLAIDDQRIDVQLFQPRGDGKAGLAAADHEDGRVAVGIGGRCVAQVEPVGAAKIARIGVAARAIDAELFLKTLEFAKLGQQCPGFQPVAIVRIGDQADDAAAAPDIGLELEDGLDCVGAGAHHLARRGAVRVDCKAAGHRAAGQRRQRFQDRVGAIERLDVPAQRQHVAPIAVGVEQLIQQGVIGLSERFLELCKPIVGGYRTVVRPVEHARFPSPAVCAAFFLRRSLYLFVTALKGREEMPPIPIMTGSAPDPAGRGR